VLSRDLRGYQELVFGAYVRNAMFFATLPYYVARKMRHGRLGSQGSDVLETGQRYRAIRLLVESPTVKRLRPLRIHPRLSTRRSGCRPRNALA